MTYKEIISVYQARYNRLSYNKQMPKLTETDALHDISLAQMELANNYYLAEAETTLVLTDGEDIYTNIPKNILNISVIQFDNGEKCFNGSIEIVRKQTKISGTPKYFLLSGKENSTLEFDCLPTGNLTATITYNPQCNMFLGNTGTTTDTEFSTSIATTQILIPNRYSNLLVERALCECFPDRYNLYEMLLKQAISLKNINFNGTLPDYYESTEETIR